MLFIKDLQKLKRVGFLLGRVVKVNLNSFQVLYCNYIIDWEEILCVHH